MTAPDRPSLLAWLVPLTLVFIVFGGVAVWFFVARTPGSGIDLEYTVAVPEADRAGVEATVRRRLDLLSIRGGQVRIAPNHVTVRLPGATPETAFRAKQLLRTAGRLEFCPAAPVDVQEKYNSDKVVPPGYRVIHNPDSRRSDDYAAYGAQVVIQQEPVIDSRHIARAEPKREMVPGGMRWVTAFEMTEDGARLFDGAALTLYNRRPPGLLVILLDGSVKSIPAIQSPAFNGRAQVSGAKDKDEAADLAIMLMSGALPVPLGDPAAERPYGPSK